MRVSWMMSMGNSLTNLWKEYSKEDAEMNMVIAGESGFLL